jgi:hypothetical protein
MQKYASLFKKVQSVVGESSSLLSGTEQTGDTKSLNFSLPPPPLKRFRSDFFDEES